jgi:hypothetical protein
MVWKVKKILLVDTGRLHLLHWFIHHLIFNLNHILMLLIDLILDLIRERLHRLLVIFLCFVDLRQLLTRSATLTLSLLGGWRLLGTGSWFFRS